MIELIEVSKYYATETGRHYVFRDVSLQLPFDKSIAVIGPNGAGKSTFMRLLGGADVPSEGRIIRTGRISPPMGLTPGLQISLSAAENARFAGRIYGLDRDEINDLIDHVDEVANIGKFFDMPVASYSAGMKQRVAFAINMSLDFDYYLFDEISAGGDREFRKYSKAKVQERLETSNFIIASHRSDELLELCDAGIVIKDGELTYYDDVKDALAAYAVDDDEDDDGARLAKRRKRAERKAAADESGAELSGETRRERVERRQARIAAKNASEANPVITPETGEIDNTVPVAAVPPAPGPVADGAVPVNVSEESVEAVGSPSDAVKLTRRDRVRLRRERIEKRQARDKGKTSPAETLTGAPAAGDTEETRGANRDKRLARRRQRQAQRLAASTANAPDPGDAPQHDRSSLRRERLERRRATKAVPSGDTPHDETPSSADAEQGESAAQPDTSVRILARTSTNT